MTKTAWDYLGRRDVRFGASRWTVEWEVWREGHGGDLPACEDHFLEDCVEVRSRSFPNRPLALAFGRRPVEGRRMAGPRVTLELFEPEGPPGSGVGSWERSSESEELQ